MVRRKVKTHTRAREAFVQAFALQQFPYQFIVGEGPTGARPHRPAEHPDDVPPVFFDKLLHDVVSPDRDG
jgi:hypothetical protein